MTNKRRATIGFAGAVALLAMGAIVGAQGPGPHGGFRGRGPGGPGGPGGGAGVPPIPNAPFSGTEVRSFMDTLEGGNAISHSSCAKVYRSSTGATRIEETRDSATCGTPSFISITDPVAGMRYEINVAKSTYFEMKLRPRPNSTTPPSGAPPNGHRGPNGDQVQKTPLGTQPISGTSLSAEGTQITFTIPAGKIGNAQPITVTSTRWYSPDLHIVVQSSSSDPRGGNSTEQMSSISTAEPAASLFQLPSGLTLETRHFGRRGPGPQGPPPPQEYHFGRGGPGPQGPPPPQQ